MRGLLIARQESMFFCDRLVEDSLLQEILTLLQGRSSQQSEEWPWVSLFDGAIDLNFAVCFSLKLSVLPWKQATTWAWRRREQNWFLILEAWKFRKTEVKGRGNYKAIWLPCVLRDAGPSLLSWLGWILLILILLFSCSHKLLIMFFTLVLEEDTLKVALLSGEELFVPGDFRLLEDISAWQTIMVIIIKWGITWQKLTIAESPPHSSLEKF